MKAALLFYKKFVSNLTSIGFNFNTYDPCVADKLINGKQTRGTLSMEQAR